MYIIPIALTGFNGKQDELLTVRDSIAIAVILLSVKNAR